MRLLKNVGLHDETYNRLDTFRKSLSDIGRVTFDDAIQALLKLNEAMEAGENGPRRK